MEGNFLLGQIMIGQGGAEGEMLTHQSRDKWEINATQSPRRSCLPHPCNAPSHALVPAKSIPSTTRQRALLYTHLSQIFCISTSTFTSSSNDCSAWPGQHCFTWLSSDCKGRVRLFKVLDIHTKDDTGTKFYRAGDTIAECSPAFLVLHIQPTGHLPQGVLKALTWTFRNTW